MPELPEVETVRRTMEQVLLGHRLQAVEVVPDEILLKGVPPEVVHAALVGRKVTNLGRKGKYWWIEFDSLPVLYGHLGMAGWIRELGAPTIRLREHGNAPLEDENGRPRFLKLLLETDAGGRIAFTDGRRLGRLWLGGAPESEPKLLELGRDTWLEPWTASELGPVLAKRTAPMKALLLDQKIFCGVGNWIADEVLFRARISPKRIASTLRKIELVALCESLTFVLSHAIEVGADKEQFPQDWLFHARWGGAKGAVIHEGKTIVRETVGGRTTAWSPGWQK